MTRNENSDDLWLQTAAKLLKMQINSSDMWAVHAFITKPVTIDFVDFYGKIPKENPSFYEEVSGQCVEKEFLVLI